MGGPRGPARSFVTRIISHRLATRNEPSMTATWLRASDRRRASRRGDALVVRLQRPPHHAIWVNQAHFGTIDRAGTRL